MTTHARDLCAFTRDVPSEIEDAPAQVEAEINASAQASAVPRSGPHTDETEKCGNASRQVGGQRNVAGGAADLHATQEEKGTGFSPDGQNYFHS